MNFVKEHIQEKSGYNLHIIRTDKYKTNTLIWKMKAPLQSKTATYRSLLHQVLQSSTAQYPSTTALRSYLDDLYGASFYTDIAKKGEYQIISFTLEIANEKFLQDQAPLLQKGIELLIDIICNPHVKNNAFDKKTVDQEKKNLKQRLKAIHDDKMRYSSMRLIQEMCKGEPFEILANGEFDQVDAITESSLFDYYEQAINEDEMDLYVIGDVNVEEVERYCQPLQFKERHAKMIEKSSDKTINDINEVIEKQDVKQGKLNIGCRTSVRYGDADYFPLQMFNGIFGGFPHSKLFINVREKASLAYYAASRIESHKGLLMIMSGIDNKNYNQAVSIIKEQLATMKEGQFSDQEIDQTKAVIQNQFLETIDSARGIVEVLYHNVVAKTNVDPKDWIEQVKNVTREQIVSVAQKVEMDTIYFLSGNEGDHS